MLSDPKPVLYREVRRKPPVVDCELRDAGWLQLGRALLSRAHEHPSDTGAPQVPQVPQQTMERTIAGLWTLADIVANPRLCRPAHSRGKASATSGGAPPPVASQRDNDRR
jgi:hypothetical protein